MDSVQYNEWCMKTNSIFTLSVLDYFASTRKPLFFTSFTRDALRLIRDYFRCDKLRVTGEQGYIKHHNSCHIEPVQMLAGIGLKQRPFL